MTVQELIDKLREFDPSATVVVECESFVSDPDLELQNIHDSEMCFGTACHHCANGRAVSAAVVIR